MILNSCRHINTILDSSTQISNEFDELTLNILEAMDVPHKVINMKHTDIPKSSQVQITIFTFLQNSEFVI